MTGSCRAGTLEIRQRKRRLVTAALCAASFATSQWIFGSEPAGVGSRPAPSVLAEYRKAKGQLAASGTAPSSSENKTAKTKPARLQATTSFASLPSGSTATNSLRPVTVESVSELPLDPAKVAPATGQMQPAGASAPVAKPAITGVLRAAATESKAIHNEENLPPIIPAWAMPRPRKMPAKTTGKDPVEKNRPELGETKPDEGKLGQVELGQVDRPRSNAIPPAALSTQTLSAMKPLDAKPVNPLRALPGLLHHQNERRPLPEIVSLPKPGEGGGQPLGKLSHEPFRFEKGPPIAPIGPIAPTAALLAMPASASDSMKNQHASDPAPLEIFNPHVKPVYREAHASRSPETDAPRSPVAESLSSPLARLEPVRQAFTEPSSLPAAAPVVSSRKPAEIEPPATVVQAKSTAPQTELLRMSNIHAFLNPASNQRAEVHEVDFEERLAIQPARP